MRARKEYLKNREKRELLEQGLNPYEVWRVRFVNKKYKRRMQQLANELKEKRVEILKRENAFELYVTKKKAAERTAKQYAIKYRESLGRKERQETMKTYLKNHTKRKVDIVDPTGREFKIFPSLVSNTTRTSF